ncbi:hypothetical protein P8452_56867 [Trifolium repens]|nr:hypothetical protein P8452_56867 [Trifolium repens]
MSRKPDDEVLKEFVLDDTNTNDPSTLQKVIRSWAQVHSKGNELRMRGIAVKEPYSQWIKECVKKIGLPFILIPSSQPSPPNPIPTSVEEVDELKATIKRLEKEKEDLQQQIHQTSYERNKFKFHFEERRKQLKRSDEMVEEERAKKERVDECLEGVTNKIQEGNDRLKQAWKEISDWKDLWNRTLKERKGMREGFEARILNLTAILKESQTIASNERQRREEADRKLQNLSANWENLLMDLRNLKDHEEQQKRDLEVLEDRVRHLETRKPRKQLLQEPAPRHSYYTQKNTQRIMDGIVENHEVMRQDIDQLNVKFDRMMETLQEIANRAQDPQPPPVENVTPEPQPVSASAAIWPPFGLPPGYTTPQLGNPIESGPSQARPTQASVPHPNGTPVIQESVPMPQGSTENPLLVYHFPNPPREYTEPSLDGRPPTTGENEESRGKILALEERVKAMEGHGEFGLDALDMCLVSNVVLPPKFKVPDFEKYKG